MLIRADTFKAINNYLNMHPRGYNSSIFFAKKKKLVFWKIVSIKLTMTKSSLQTTLTISLAKVLEKKRTFNNITI